MWCYWSQEPCLHFLLYGSCLGRLQACWYGRVCIFLSFNSLITAVHFLSNLHAFPINNVLLWRDGKTSFSITTYDCSSGAYFFIFEEDMDINLKKAGALWENRMRIIIYKTKEYSNQNNNTPKAYQNNT